MSISNRIGNDELSDAVRSRQLFYTHTGNVYSEITRVGYCVFSYGAHFPIAVHVDGYGWFVNEDKYSVTTTNHQNQCLAYITAHRYLSTDEIISLADAASYEAWATGRVVNATAA